MRALVQFNFRKGKRAGDVRRRSQLSKMAEVSGLRSRNHFDSNASRDRDEGKSAPGSTGPPPAVAGSGSTSLFAGFSLISAVFVWTKVCFPLAGVLPRSSPAAGTSLPPRNVSGAACGPIQTRSCHYLSVSAAFFRLCRAAVDSDTDTCRLARPWAATFTRLEDRRAPAAQAAGGSSSAGSEL